MSKRLIITESQLTRLKNRIQEGEVLTRMVGRIKKDLDMNYEPTLGVIRKGGEYSEEPMIKVKVDGEMITPKALYDYLQFKYKMGDDFIKQVIKDWVFGKIDDTNTLSKNVTLR